MRTIFRRLRDVEDKLDALLAEQNISLEEQPKFKIVREKKEIGFHV